MASDNNSERKGFTITWIIENFKYSTYRYGEILESPTFVVDTMEETKWRLFLCLVFDDAVEDDLLLDLRRMLDSKGPPSIKIDIEYALLTEDGWVFTQRNVTEKEFMKYSKISFHSFNLNEIYADEPEKILPNDKLTVRCKMWKCCGEINNDGYCTARTHIGVEKQSSIWSIRNFSTLQKGNELTYRINSTLNDKSIVTLKFSVTGEDERLQVRFISSDSEDESSSLSIKFSVLDSKRRRCNMWCSRSLFFFFSCKRYKIFVDLNKKRNNEK
ncbi:speckle-type POZ protein [Caerostris extrusa]|uniref:Speckle-type POZ protein n=1 Tax=Caerostris extrusa TaxID=172846 RepID=A0AAV4M9X4_CAEEX|nr:speckle-type POZ protein [Caerostris extrusa]